MNKKIKSYVIGILIPVAVGLLAAFLTKDSMDIYKSIVQPPLAPPAILFPIVWSILYIVMGIGSALIYNSAADEKDKTQALFVYALQLAVNFFWSILFFNVRAFLFSFIWLLLLWVLIIIMIVRFSKVNKVAAYLQIPYLLWVTFAGYLNLAIYILNR
ncbi:MAG: tryptophan-rich sensory protein [Ruminococcaceae bacterium]|nr:tryptophan-rich sensory protein [Oscillospiraceae bacterium]